MLSFSKILASSGRCRVLGADSRPGLPKVIGRVGALVESPGLNPGLSARQTLTVLATTAGIGPAQMQEIAFSSDSAVITLLGRRSSASA